MHQVRSGLRSLELLKYNERLNDIKKGTRDAFIG